MSEAPQGLEQFAKPERQSSIVSTEVTQYESGIPLKGWESVNAALDTFASGKSRGSRATEQHQLKAIGESYGGFAAAFYSLEAPHMGGGGNSFVKRMLEEAQPSVASRGRWSRSYDYDGQGSFFKTTVDINRVGKEDNYILQLNAAYVGNQVEEGLAENLGVERGVSWKNVEVVFEPEGNQFKIDFEQVAGKLTDVVGELQPSSTKAGEKKTGLAGIFGSRGGKRGTEVSGKTIAEQLMRVDKYGDSEGPFVLGTKDGVEVTVGLGRAGRRFEWKDGVKSEDKWRADGAVITGPLDTDYRDESKLIPPSISISIRPQSEDKYSRLPAVDPKVKATMNDLTQRISSAFSPGK